MIIPSKTRFVDTSTKEAFLKLKEGDNSEKELFRFINQAMNNIENLWKYDLPNAWRLIYSIRGGKAVVISIILEWLSHKDYEKRFNY